MKTSYLTPKRVRALHDLAEGEAGIKKCLSAAIDHILITGREMGMNPRSVLALCTDLSRIKFFLATLTPEPGELAPEEGEEVSPAPEGDTIAEDSGINENA